MAEVARRPKWSVAQTVGAGKAALGFEKGHSAKLAKRLDENFWPTLTTDVAALEVGRDVRVTKKSGQTSATAAQNTTVLAAADWVAAFRKGVRRKTDSAEIRKAFGIGQRVSRGSVASVSGAVATVLQGMEAHKASWKSLGIVTEDVETGVTHQTGLSAADTTQEAAVITASDATTDRDKLRVKVQQSVDALVGAAELEFVGDRKLVERFRELVPSQHRPKKPQ